MAYLTVRLSAGAYQPVGNFTPVSATVSITWDTSESYDQTHGTGTITVGGNSASFSTDFNAGRTESGTQVLGGLSASIKHNSNGDPVQVVARASGAGRSASDTITLPGGTPSGGGDSGDGGDSGGGDGGNTGGSGGDVGGTETELTTLKISLLPEEHTSIKAVVVYAEGYSVGTVLKNGDEFTFNGNDKSTWPKFQIFYEVDDGYIIKDHVINPTLNGGITFESGYTYALADQYAWTSTLTIKTSAYPALVTSHTLSINAGAGATVNVSREFSHAGDITTLSNGDTVYLYDTIRITCNASSKYVVSSIIVNGHSFKSGETIIVDGDVSIVVTTKLYKFSVSDMEQCCTKYWKSSGLYWVGYDTYYGAGSVGFKYIDDTYITGYYFTTILKFISPNFTGNVTTIEFSLKTQSGSEMHEHYYALCTSDENKSLYENANDIVSDPYQIASGIFNSKKITVHVSDLQPNTTYYLYMYGGSSITALTSPREYTGDGGSIYNYSILFSYPKDVVFIDNETDAQLYACYIDDGTNWNIYAPYITVEKHYSWDRLFTATVNVTDSGLYLRSDTSTSYTNLVLMPNETELTVEDIAIGDDGTTILAKTTYGSQTGWANTKYLDFTIYGIVNNESGTPFYLTYESDANTWYDFEYGQEVVIGGNLNYTELIVNDGLIWGNVNVDNGDGTSLGGYIKMQDIDILSERTALEWVKIGI